MTQVDAESVLRQQLAGPLAGLLAADRPVIARSAPGRLDVLGGLGAQAGGTVAQMALPQRAAVAVQLRDDGKLVMHSNQIGPPVGEPQVSVKQLQRKGAQLPLPEMKNELNGMSEPTRWAAPLVALWYTLQQVVGEGIGGAKGATIVVHSTIPMGAGQASSTALVTAVATALAEALKLKAEPMEQAVWIQRSESLTQADAGQVIDALTCLLAEEPGISPTGKPAPKLLRFSSQPYQLVGHVKLPQDVRIMALDTGVRYRSAHETLESLRMAGAMGLRIVETIYRDLGQRHTPLHGYLANVSPLLYRQYFRPLLPKRLRGSDFMRTYGELPERVGTLDPAKMYRVRTAVDHLITENEHAEQFLQAMEELAEEGSLAITDLAREKTLQRAGRLALASHHSYRLRLELSCREADWLVDRLMEAGPERGVYGARITSCGGGGTVMAVLGRTTASNDALLDVYEAYNKVTGGVALSIVEAGTAGSGGTVAT